jgi:L-lactate utilization protein LutC
METGGGPLVYAPAGTGALARFVSNLEQVAGVAHLVDPRSTADAVVSILRSYEATRTLAWDEAAIGGFGVHAALDAAEIDIVGSSVGADPESRARRHAEYGELIAGVTGADAGLAESGSIVLASGPGRGRMVSLIPKVHVAILRSADIHESLSHYAMARPDAASATGNLVIITGPSRTGDIETHLNLGVHGPHHLHVVIVDG